MATINGTNLIISLNGTAFGHAKECDMDITQAGRDVTTKSSAGWKEAASDGMRSWKITGKGLIDFTDTSGFSALFDFMVARTSVSITFGSHITGNKYYSGTAVIKSLKGGGPLEESAPYDFELEGSGVLIESSGAS